jgi:hypothetical protein
MLSSLLLPVSTALLCLEQVYAWSQYQHFGHRVMNTVLRLRDNENDDVDYERSRLENLFADHVTDFHNDLAPLISNVEQMKNLPVNDWMGSSNAFDNEWADTGACYEDECDVSTTRSFYCVQLFSFVVSSHDVSSSSGKLKSDFFQILSFPSLLYSNVRSLLILKMIQSALMSWIFLEYQGQNHFGCKRDHEV